jgi:hypothetical protein
MSIALIRVITSLTRQGKPKDMRNNVRPQAIAGALPGETLTAMVSLIWPSVFLAKILALSKMPGRSMSSMAQQTD